MFSGGLFSLGNAGPYLLLFLGPAAIIVISAIAAIVVRCRADSAMTQDELQYKVDAGITVYAISGPLSLAGMILNRYWVNSGVGLIVAIAGVFVATPLGALLTYRGQVVGRKEILWGTGVAVLWILGVIAAMIVQG